MQLVDAVGISPINEIIFFWNGFKPTKQLQLETCLEIIIMWSDANSRNSSWSYEGLDEKAFPDVLQGAGFRSLHYWDEAKKVLRAHVLHVNENKMEDGLYR